jgi:hypothetical protein
MPIEMVRYYFITCDACDRPYTYRGDEAVNDYAQAEHDGWLLDRDPNGEPESATCPVCQGKRDKPTWDEAFALALAKCEYTDLKGWEHIQIQVLKKGGYRLVSRSYVTGGGICISSSFVPNETWAYTICQHLAAEDLCYPPE